MSERLGDNLRRASEFVRTLPTRKVDFSQFLPQMPQRPGPGSGAMDWVNYALQTPGVVPMGKITWHGSPHLFDRFDLKKIGTGEGAQSRGHGMYLADKRDVAKAYRGVDESYQQALLDLHKRTKDDWAQQVIEDAMLHRTIPELRKMHPGAGGFIDRTIARIPRKEGHLYKVDLADEALPRLLNLEAPFAGQTPFVKEALRSLGVPKMRREIRSDFTISPSAKVNTGEGILEMLEKYSSYGPEGAANMLDRVGIPGSKYWDQGSRPMWVGHRPGSRSRNYVMWDTDLLKILDRE